MELDKLDNPLVWVAADLANGTFMEHDYGNSYEYRKPNINELIHLRGIIDAAIHELIMEKKIK